MYKYTQILILLTWGAIWAGCQPAPEDSNASSESERVEAASEQAPRAARRNVMIFGDSITAGYGLQESEAFPALLQAKIDELEWSFDVINAGLSGDTSAGGLRRISWMLRTPVDVFVLELGGNDGLRGTSPEVTKQNLQEIIDLVRDKNPDVRVIIAGMQIPPNLGLAHTQRFRELFGELAKENDASLIPFLLEDVGGIPALNQPDGIHPTAEGHEIVAKTVWETLYPELLAIVKADPSCGDPNAAADCEAGALVVD